MLLAASAGLALGAFPVEAATTRAGGSLLYTVHDSSGRVTVSMFTSTTPDMRSAWRDVETTVGDDAMVAIGGGATGAEFPAGALLTASYPNESRTGWTASAKDHGIEQKFRLTTYVIGLKVAGMSRDELKSYLTYNSDGQQYGSHPSASSHLDSETDELLGGGFDIDWNGWGNLATASFPTGPVQWTAASKDHLQRSPATIHTWAIGIRRNLPVGRVESYVREPVEVGPAAHPSAAARIRPGYVMTGGGGKATYGGWGCMLWNLAPSVDNSGYQSFTAGAKDHAESDESCKVKSWAIGIRLV